MSFEDIELGRQDQSKPVNTTHGESFGGSTNKIGTPEYRSWRAMINRCYRVKNDNYKDYGGRGIIVCTEWQYSYEAFLAYMGRRPSLAYTLDRINHNGNYEPGNVRWSLAKEQSNNRRKRQDIKKIRFDGRYLTVREWSEVLNIPYYVLSQRLTKLGWGIEKSLTTPNNSKKVVIC
jgi:hypothetical protein